MDADGDFVVVWDSYLQDGDGRGIFAQRFVGPEEVDISVVAKRNCCPASMRYSAAHGIGTMQIPARSTPARNRTRIR